MSCNRALELSLLIDGELAGVDAPAAVEHLLSCGECQGFFRRGRALDAALLLAAAEETEAAEAAPAEVWRRIGAAVGRDLRREAAPAVEPKRRAGPAWLQAVAAALLLVLGGTAGWQLAAAQRNGATDGRAMVTVGAPRAGFATAADRSPAHRPPMDEARFVAIARELLAADRRYRDAMAGVLVVADSDEPREGSTAESSWREEDLRALRPDAPRLY
jgi:hypothetical protein